MFYGQYSGFGSGGALYSSPTNRVGSETVALNSTWETGSVLVTKL